MGLMRILHVVGETNRGGTETWLLHVLRELDRKVVKFDFVVYRNGTGDYDEELRRLGCRILACGKDRYFPTFGWELRRLVSSYGPYDVIHSHVHHFSGRIVLYGALCGVGVRIAHSHNDTEKLDRNAGALRRCYIRVSRALIRRYATAGLAVSSAAARSLFGQGWASDSRWRILPSCVDLSAFGRPSGFGLRRELGIPENARVIGHVGRFYGQKNHQFFIDVASALSVREPCSYFVLVGAGPVKREIELRVKSAGLAERFLFLSPRGDVPRLMLEVFDGFLFPSLYEGLGLVLVEAQAAGLRCFIPTVLPSEVVAVPGLVLRIPLSDGAEAWAEVISEEMKTPAKVPQREAFRLASAAFDIKHNADELMQVYRDLTSRHS